jgi:hypothetical protein
MCRTNDDAEDRHEEWCDSLRLMPITDADQALVVKQLIHDLHATLGSDYDYVAVNNAGRLRQFIDDRETYFEKVVDATQQDIHDEFIDTVWPKCPRHSHPLWRHDGAWWCENDKWLVARLGELESHGVP